MGDGRIRYARNGEIRLAYRILGDGDEIIVFAPGWAGNVGWYDEPTNLFAAATQMVTRDMRVLVFDRRGNGLSDAANRILTPNDRAADLTAILDDAGLERVPLFAVGDSGPGCIQFAASHPERVRSLVLYGSAARFSQRKPDFPWGFPREVVDDIESRIDTEWGEGLTVELLFGDAADMPGVREMLGRLQRATVGPAGVRLQWREANEVDVRGLLDSVSSPTLVLARPGDRMVPFEASAALASGIPGAQFHPLRPGPHIYFDILDAVWEAVVGFVFHKREASLPERLLKTILFTDIVASTELLSSYGDKHWHYQLNLHDSTVDGVLSTYQGQRVKHTGDGIFALFESPTRAVRCAHDLVGALAAVGLPIRVGVHIGECERRGSEWSGMAIHVAARICGLAGAGQVLTSRTVRDVCAGSGLNFNDFGAHHLKGVPEDVVVYLAN